MAINLLTARRVATVIPQNKPYCLKDGGSLFLYVTPKGSHLWRYRYRIARQEGIYAIGIYPEVSLAAARRERDRARALVLRGVHPLLDKKLRLFQQLERNSNTFESMAESWIKTNKDWSENY